MNRGTIILATNENISIWDYTNGNKLWNKSDEIFNDILTDNIRLFAIDPRGLVYRYDNLELFSRGLTQIEQ